jgi:hypothetical protein
MGVKAKQILEKFVKSDILLYIAVLMFALKIAFSLAHLNFPQNIFFADITESSLENLVNQTRQSMGLQPLIENQKLSEAAKLKAQNMVENNYFSHTSPNGTTPWHWFSKVGYNYKYAGENLAIGFYDSSEVFDAWINSPSHRTNLLNPNYKEEGIAVLHGFGPNNATVVVQLLGSAKPTSSILHESNNKITTETKVANVPTALPQVQGVQDSNNYEGLLQNVIFSFSLLVIGLMIYAILFGSKESFQTKNFAFKSVIILILIMGAMLVNRDVIIYFIPHQVAI